MDAFEDSWAARFGPGRSISCTDALVRPAPAPEAAPVPVTDHWLGDEEMYYGENNECICVRASETNAIASLSTYAAAARLETVTGGVSREADEAEGRICRKALEDLVSKRFCVFPVNEYGNHWAMLALCTEDGTYAYVDSLVPTSASRLGPKSRALVQRAEDTLRTMGRGRTLIQVDTGPHRLQRDAVSCGAMYAEYARCVMDAAAAGARTLRQMALIPRS